MVRKLNFLAIGKCSCTGLSGGNHFASNLLIEAIVYIDAVSKHSMNVLEHYDFKQ